MGRRGQENRRRGRRGNCGQYVKQMNEFNEKRNKVLAIRKQTKIYLLSVCFKKSREKQMLEGNLERKKTKEREEEVWIVGKPEKSLKMFPI